MLGTHWGSKDETKYEADEKLWMDAAIQEKMIDENMVRTNQQEVS
jgi:hypothetical protein